MEEFKQLVSNFQKNEVSQYGELPQTTRRLISFAILTALGTPQAASDEVEAALKEEVPPVAMVEAVIQATPYAGSAKTMEMLAAVEQALVKNGVSLPLEDRSTVTQENRLEKGLAAQYAIFGKETIDRNRQTAPPELRHIQEYLSGYCFGDFYTRTGIDLKTRELLTFCILCAMGGCEPQLKAHIAGNLQVGNHRNILLSAVTWCLPYLGFPRTLNAISCIQEIAKE